MWVLLIPAAVIIGAWAWGASKVASNAPPLPTNPPGTPIAPTPKPITVDGHGTGVIAPLKKGDTVVGDFGNATNVHFLVVDPISEQSPFVMVQLPSGGPAIQMPRDSITQIIPA
jgi:hypothetical protein